MTTMHFDELREVETISVDGRGRGPIVKPSEIQPGVKYRKYMAPDGTIVLQPVVEIPVAEAWLYRNSKALASVERGLEQSARGEATPRRSYAEFADSDLE